MSEETKPEAAAPPEKERISSAAVLLGKTLLELLRLNPTNPQVRAQVMAKCKQSPPPEATTFEQLVDWLEFNVPDENSWAYIEAGAATPAVELVLNCSETELGSCNYSCVNSGVARVPFSEQELRALADEAESFQELWDNLLDELSENWGDYVDWRGGEDYEYEGHEASDSDNSDWSFQNTTFAKEQVRAALERLFPERMREWRGEV